MTAAAVLGAHAPLGVAARLADLDDPLPALEEATNAGLLEAPVGDGPRTVAFTHPLARAAVYHDLGAAQRAELHRRAAEIVGGPDALDHRVAATPLEDAELADDLEADARRLLAEGMVAAAASRLVASARLAPDPSRRGALVLEAAERLLDAGDAAEAAGLAGEIGSFAASAARSYILGQLAMFGGQLADAERLLVDAWDQARASGGDRLAARAAGLLAQLNGLRDCLDDASKWARRALALTDDLSVTSTALSVLVGVLAGTGRADEAIELADDVDSAELQASSVEVLQGRGLARLWTDDLAGARADITAVVRAGRRAPAARSSLIALGYLAEAEFRIGAWDDSVVHADLAVSLARDSDQPWLDGFVHAQALWVLAARGDWERAAAYAATATAPGPFGEPLPRGCIGAALAHLAFCRGEPAQVVAAVQPLVAQPQRGLLDGPGVYRWRELYVDALVTLGYLDEAEAVLGPFERLAVAQGRRSCLAVIEQARARIAAARGDDTEARAGFELALEHAQSVRAPFEQASVEDAYGRYLRRAGERRAAAELLGRARDVYLRLGARPFVEPVERELQGCGLTPAGRRSPEPTRLTPQELAVARLVASGLTNRETAAELVVSVKTVEYHLGHVYQKLGVRSRTELAGQFATSGAPQDSPGTD
jgi:DNA-binding CsgD family transcriptional regulator